MTRNCAELFWKRMIKMSKNLFEQIDEEKKDIPKIDKALNQYKNLIIKYSS